MTDIYDQAQMTTATTGNGVTITLGATVTGYQSFASAGMANNANSSYGIQDSGSNWEVGSGTYITNSSGTFWLRNNIQYSSNAGGPINLSGGAQVYLTMLQQDYDTFTPANSVNVGANVIINTTAFFFGNSTANNFSNSSSETIANSTGNVVSTPTSILLQQNATANVFVNSSAVLIYSNSATVLANLTANNTSGQLFLGASAANNMTANATIVSVTNSTANTQIGHGTVVLQGTGSNTGLTLGTHSSAANGYTFLPNGLLLQWGIASAVNSTTQFWSYPVTFPTTFFSMTVTGTVQSANGAHPGTVTITPNTSGANLVTSNTTSQTVYWMAIGN